MRELHMFADFRAGLNTDSAPDHLADNEVAVADNIDLSEHGGVKTRLGLQAVNEESYEGCVTQVFEWARDNGSIVRMAVIGNKLCEMEPLSGESNEIDTVGLPHVSYFANQDKLYYLTGNALKVYDGESVAEVEVDIGDEEGEGKGRGSCSFSSGGDYLAIAHSLYPYITIYKNNEGIFEKMLDPAVLPSGKANDCSLTSDGTFFAVAHEGGKLFTVYKREGEVFDKLANLPGLPQGSKGSHCCFSADGSFLAVRIPAFGTRTLIYERNGDAFSLVDFDVSDHGFFNGKMVFSPDGQHLAYSRSSGAKVAKRSTVAGKTVFTEQDLSLAMAHGEDVSFSSDGKHIVFKSWLGIRALPPTGSKIAVFKKSGDSFVLCGAPLQDDQIFGSVSFLNGGTHLAVLLKEDPYVLVFENTNGTLSIIDNHDLVLESEPYRVCSGGNLVAITHKENAKAVLYSLDEGVFSKEDEVFTGSSSWFVHRCKFVVRHVRSQRYFYAGNPDDGAALYFSEPGEPGNVKETSKMYPTTGDGPITGLAIFVDAVLVFFKSSIWTWRGADPDTDAVWQKLPTTEGTQAPYTIQQVQTGLMYLGSKGLINLSPSLVGMSIEMETKGQAVFDVSANRIERLINSITHPEIASAAYDSKRGLYLLAYTDGEEKLNKHLLVIDNNMGITRWPDVYINDVHNSLDGGVLFAKENFIAKQVEDFYQDIQQDGEYEAVKAVIQTRRSVLGDFSKRKLLSSYRVVLEGQEHPLEFLAEVLVDDEVVLTKTVNLAERKGVVQLRNVCRKLGNRASLRVTDSSGQAFMLYALGIEATPVNSYGSMI